MQQNQKMKWKCEYCGCESDVVQVDCPNGCPNENPTKKGSFVTIRNHKNWCKSRNSQDCNCEFNERKT